MRSLPVPFVVLSYYNPILAMGLDRFPRKARESGVDGIVVPGFAVEEATNSGTLP